MIDALLGVCYALVVTKEEDMIVENIQVSAKSGNSKTGPIPTTGRPMTTCPQDCPFLPTGEIGGCYATGRINATTEKWSSDMSVSAIVDKINKGKHKAARFFRDRVVGDVMTKFGHIDYDYIQAMGLVAEKTGLVGFSYTHAWRMFTSEGVAHKPQLRPQCVVRDTR